MLKKYLNYRDAISLFLHFSLYMILCYTISVTLYITMPPDDVHYYFILETGKLYLEYILASILIMMIIVIILTHFTTDKK